MRQLFGPGLPPRVVPRPLFFADVTADVLKAGGIERLRRVLPRDAKSVPSNRRTLRIGQFQCPFSAELIQFLGGALLLLGGVHGFLLPGNLSCYPKRSRAKECDGDHRIVGSPRPSSSERSGSQTTKHRNHALKHHPLKHHPTSAFSSATRSFTNAAATASYCHCMTSQLPVQETHQPRKWTVSPPMRSC